MSNPLMNAVKRFLGIMELGNGRFARELQDHFQNAQVTASNTGLKVTITAKVVITPPERDMHNRNMMIAQCATHVTSSTSKPKAKAYQLEIDAETGAAITCADSIEGLLQEELKFPEEEKTAPFQQKGSAR